MSLQKALNQYQQINAHEAISGASPHRLIQMLMEGVVERIAVAKGAMQRGDIAQKGLSIGKAISIVGGLSDSLNLEVDSDIPANLDSLYGYVVECLMTANAKNDEAKLDEALAIIKTIKSGWDEIAAEAV
ncbi:flagellar export chaperone FliS [Dasania marina]|uniref:flagellar export chaperone FliS n=1 Tax=Dasania marina TaxID=471499 RepID=UPI00035FB5C6|nr:flagellar export chaperone FliS [Dasania marina]